LNSIEADFLDGPHTIPSSSLFFSSNNNGSDQEKGPGNYNGPSTNFRLILGSENTGLESLSSGERFSSDRAKGPRVLGKITPA
jgi:hypothetical protein